MLGLDLVVSLQTHHCEARFCPAATRVHKELRKLQGASSLCVPGQRPAYHQRLLISWQSTGLAPSPSNATTKRCLKRDRKGISSVPVVGQGVQGGLEREICSDREDKQCLNGRVRKTISQGQDVRHNRTFNGWAVIRFLVIFSSAFQYACDWLLHAFAKTPETHL